LIVNGSFTFLSNALKSPCHEILCVEGPRPCGLESSGQIFKDVDYTLYTVYSHHELEVSECGKLVCKP